MSSQDPVSRPVSALHGADCKTCRHWLFEESDWQYDKLRFGKCGAIQQREDVTEPARALQDWREREAEEERLLGLAKAIAVDGSGYYAALRTAPDFGCVLHSAADDPKGQDGQLRDEPKSSPPGSDEALQDTGTVDGEGV